ncbi:hypothetical protein VTO42DRAFT_992 [Malbranchea cinnamomea]
MSSHYLPTPLFCLRNARSPGSDDPAEDPHIRESTVQTFRTPGLVHMYSVFAGAFDAGLSPVALGRFRGILTVREIFPSIVGPSAVMPSSHDGALASRSVSGIP